MRKLQVVTLSLALIVAGMGLQRWSAPKTVHAQSSFAPFNCPLSKPFSSASSLQVLAGLPSQNIVICNALFGSIGGSTFSVVEGTGTTCATNTAAVAGGTTAAAGFGLAANGVMTSGSGTGIMWHTVTPGDNVCLIIAGTGPLAGSVSYGYANI